VVFLFAFLMATALLFQFPVEWLEEVFVLALGARHVLQAAPHQVGRPAFQAGASVAVGADEGLIQFGEPGY
jgi:hypothetical protein